MPELPEVETIRRQLSGELVGQVFESVDVLDPKVFAGDAAHLIGEKIVRFGRVGKYLIVVLSGERGMVVHLKMTGRMVIGGAEMDYASAPHTRIVAKFTSGRTLYYWDTRRFGYWHVHEQIGKVETELKTRLGKEPWEIKAKDWHTKISKIRRPIKEVILDQTKIAGVGNIYANDGLWLAGIDPRRRANALTVAETKRLIKALQTVMERGLETGGASDNTYRNLYGERGTYQDNFLVYGKTKGKCPKCHKDLKYFKVGGRGTWMCEKCQT